MSGAPDSELAEYLYWVAHDRMGFESAWASDTADMVAALRLIPIRPIHIAERESTSEPGDFYVENNCRISYGVPQMVAPDLIGWASGDRSVCYWKKQPSTSEEMRQAFAVFDAQEAGCHRYGGDDPEIQARVGVGNCDYPVALPGADAALKPLELRPPAAEPSFWRRAVSLLRRLGWSIAETLVPFRNGNEGELMV